MHFPLLAALLAIAACGKVADKTSATGTATGINTAPIPGVDPAPDVLKGKAKLTLFGKSVYVDDDLYQLDCNQFFANFWIDKDNPSCVAVTTNTDLVFADTSNNGKDGESWTIKDPNGKVNVTGFEPDSARTTLVVGGTSYYCLLFTLHDAYKADGTLIIGSGHVILSKKGATKPSEIDPDQVLGVAIDNSALCDGRS